MKNSIHIFIFQTTFLCLILYFKPLNAQIDQNYDINDPRNPDCPCHKYQKLADEEFKNLTANSDKKNIQAIDNKVENKLSEKIEKNSSNIELKKTEQRKNRHKTHRRRKRTHPAIRKLIESISNVIRKELINVYSCYHWK